MSSAAESATVVEEAKTETTAIGKKKVEKTGNLIVDIAHEVEGLTKTKALNEADRLAENIEVNYFKMGGVLKLINDNSWFEGFELFDDFVREKYGFEGRKARYLVSIYDNLVTKMIPWEKVSHLGWTKLKDLAPVLTVDNVDEWVAKAEKLTVKELLAIIKEAKETGEGGDKKIKTTDEFVKINFKLKPDQAEIVTQALAKAKGELHTEFDAVAIENICMGYVGGTISVPKPFSLDEVIETTGFEPMLKRIAELFPSYDITVAPVEA
jgi:hypothetical protein